MNKCAICNKEIKNDSQFVKGKWYHNDCIENLNNIIENLDKMFEYYFLGNLKYDQDTVNAIYIKYVKLKELESKGE